MQQVHDAIEDLVDDLTHPPRIRKLIAAGLGVAAVIAVPYLGAGVVAQVIAAIGTVVGVYATRNEQ